MPMIWKKPTYTRVRLGFEITMYAWIR